jgi:FkbM family methyltransferase
MLGGPYSRAAECDLVKARMGLRGLNLLRRLRRTATPVGVADRREAVAYGRSHGLEKPLRDWFNAYQRGKRFGLDLIPDGMTLDGLILDVGANVGDFAAVVRRLEPRSRVTCFEPGREPLAQLRRRFLDDPNVRIDGRAVSNESGVSVLNMPENSEFASLLPQQELLGTMYPGLGSQVVATEQIETVDLDSVVTEPVRLLKIDVQGHEIAAFDGARRTVHHTSAVLVEVNFVSHYEGDVGFAEIDSYLRGCGFELVGLGSARRHLGRVLWADACYARRGQPREGGSRRLGGGRA